jgi:hypothetical protein
LAVTFLVAEGFRLAVIARMFAHAVLTAAGVLTGHMHRPLLP